MTIEVRGKAPNFNVYMVRLALHLWVLPRTLEMIRVVFQNCNCDFENVLKYRSVLSQYIRKLRIFENEQAKMVVIFVVYKKLSREKVVLPP